MVIGDVVAHLKPQKFSTLVMYCIITNVLSRMLLAL